MVRIPGFVLLMFFMAFWSCQSKEIKENDLLEIESVYFMIEDSLTLDYLHYQNAGLKYVENELFVASLFFSSGDLSFHIQTANPTLEINYRDNSSIDFSYLFQKGDSVLIKVKDKMPWFEVLNRKTKAHEINFESLRNKALYQSRYSGYQDFYLIWNMSQGNPTVDFSADLNATKSKALEKLSLEKAWLDSLLQLESIPEKAADYFMNKTEFERNKLALFDPKKDSLYLTDLSNVILEISDYSNLYQMEFADLVLDRLDGFSDEKVDVEDLFKGEFGKLLLFKYLERQIFRLSFEESEQLIARYRNEVKSSWFSILVDNTHSTKSLMRDIQLEDEFGNIFEFEDLLALKEGKYLYIDFWAAWCIPCIRSFPASLALNEKFNDLEVLYLSIDENQNLWKDAVQKYGVNIPNQSFLITNKESSAFLNGIKLQSIPRYLIFDKEGDFIHPNAPRPDSKEELKKIIQD
ncbi:TlpA family protein disulfide reductase [Belliella sp. DSM 107340]|uniref:TlpA family protein disulfide reductase n=1 Tax=Belliella calami TaxID=2923436 RepID=A0ABS9URL7_9BACT|nr:TlpA disulfide reductase family protein [Belliella calami]MCH7399262.1 TlpA family protein disulfide reductase [Belliella calami]